VSAEVNNADQKDEVKLYRLVFVSAVPRRHGFVGGKLVTVRPRIRRRLGPGVEATDADPAAERHRRRLHDGQVQ